jgi:ribosomal protein L37AE/L43A
MMVKLSTSDNIDAKIRDLRASWEGAQEPETCPKCGLPMQYSQDANRKGTWTCGNCGKQIAEGLDTLATMPIGRKIGKYFLHGLVYSLLSIVLSFMWSVVAVFLVLTGFLIGIAIALFLLVLIAGAVNTFVSQLIWKFSMNDSIVGIFTHGAVLGIIFILIGLVTIIPIILIIGNPFYMILLEIAMCFVRGFIGEKVAEHWRE